MAETPCNALFRQRVVEAPGYEPRVIVGTGVRLMHEGEQLDPNSIFGDSQAWKYKELLIAADEGAVYYGRPGIPGGSPSTRNGAFVEVSGALRGDTGWKPQFTDAGRALGLLAVGDQFEGQVISSICSIDQRDYQSFPKDTEIDLVYDASFVSLDKAVKDTLGEVSAWGLVTKYMFDRGKEDRGSKG